MQFLDGVYRDDPAEGGVCRVEQVVGGVPHRGEDDDRPPIREILDNPATCRMRSALATEEPPNFITIIPSILLKQSRRYLFRLLDDYCINIRIVSNPRGRTSTRSVTRYPETESSHAHTDQH
jgi:hypothetical protein